MDPRPRSGRQALLEQGCPADQGVAARMDAGFHRQIESRASWTRRLTVQGAPAIDETQPVEGLWPSLKGMELANLTSPSLAEVVDQTYRGIDRVGRTPHLAYSFLRHAGLSVA